MAPRHQEFFRVTSTGRLQSCVRPLNTVSHEPLALEPPTSLTPPRRHPMTTRTRLKPPLRRVLTDCGCSRFMFCLPKVTRILVMFLEFRRHYQRSPTRFFVHSMVNLIQTVPSRWVYAAEGNRPCNTFLSAPVGSASLEIQHVKPVVAITFHAARLGFEAQNAVAFRLMRLVGDASKADAGGTIADKIAAPPDVRAAATKVAWDGDRGVTRSSRSTKSDRVRDQAQAL